MVVACWLLCVGYFVVVVSSCLTRDACCELFAIVFVVCCLCLFVVGRCLFLLFAFVV